jgi:rhomboid protease GluP
MVTTAGTSIATADERVLHALWREPGALTDGEWWRVVTPLLAQSDGWGPFALNMVGLLVAGTFAERRFGHGRMLITYLASGIAGHTAGLWWQPYGSGYSVGVLGLIGMLAAAYLLLAPDWRPKVGGVLIVAAGVALAASENIHGPALLVGLALGLLFARTAPMRRA